MSSTRQMRLVGAQVAALLTLAFSLLYVSVFYDPSLAKYSVRGVTLLAIFLSVVAFVLSVRIRSPTVGWTLILGGLAIQIPPVQAIAERGAVQIPGPILGVIFFSPILILGVVKLVMMRRLS
jgi:hypothetical protein